MDRLFEQIEEHLKELIIPYLMSCLSSMFNCVNDEVGAIASDVATTPSAFSPSVFNMIRNISDTVIMPIAGIILTFVACYELMGKRTPTSFSGQERGVSLDEFYRNALGQGLEYELSTRRRGFLPAGLVEEIRALAVPPVPWDVKLSEWFNNHISPLEKHRSYAHPSRGQSCTPDIPRARYITSETENAVRTFGVIIDTSGSMETSEIGKALLFKDGSCLINKKISMDSFSTDVEEHVLHEIGGSYAGHISFSPARIKYNAVTRELYLDADDVVLSFDDYSLEDEENQKREKSLRERGIKEVLIDRISDNRLHYAV
mgnify:CR=1 FL=1